MDADGPGPPGSRGQQFGHSVSMQASHDSAHDADAHPDHPESRRKTWRLESMTAVLAANSGAMPLEEVKSGAFSSAPCGHPVCSRLQYRRGISAFNQTAGGCGAGGAALTYPVTFSQCNKILALCYNPRREFRNCEIRQAPGMLPRRIRCPPKLCFLAAGRLVITNGPSRPAERTAHLTSPRLRSC
ncbi:protein of unknown function [Cupriavidus neocaledonicus]|uniref:Uncharacterized protein n=1 Tax=Cupriavidus neocaledonicus TaxID=1040979 RepID=A0A375H5N5_9BURK|nr:hypothetical protein CBM2605_A190054 [Cupriavidus neocaledonicus]SPD47534.1 protein of unknown function [Cupriavidus neocaledonicus]